MVYTGKLDPPIVAGVWEIVFDKPYKYNGGNLLLGTENTEKGNYSNREFDGITVSNASTYGYSSIGFGNINPVSPADFLPKITFVYYE